MGEKISTLFLSWLCTYTTKFIITFYHFFFTKKEKSPKAAPHHQTLSIKAKKTLGLFVKSLSEMTVNHSSWKEVKPFLALNCCFFDKSAGFSDQHCVDGC